LAQAKSHHIEAGCPTLVNHHGNRNFTRRRKIMPSSFRDLRVWRDAMKLASDTYRATTAFPKHELYGLSQQMRRAAVSVPSNIAEGKGHHSNRGFAIFLFHARGSLLELQTQIEIAKDLNYLPDHDAQSLLDEATSVGRSLSGLINSLGAGSANDQRPRTNDQTYV
jgi:four helix bundle protein